VKDYEVLQSAKKDVQGIRKALKEAIPKIYAHMLMKTE